MARFFGVAAEAQTPPAPAELWGSDLPDRPPNLCPGCPHRAMYYAVKMALKDLGREGIFPTDIGCYTLGLLPPLSMADYLICMGSSISTAAGISRATGQTVVAFIGDSTFFHAGLTGLANAVHNGHDFLLVILDNGTTAMTGHQPHPGVTMVPSGYPGKPINIEGIVRALGVEQVWKVNPLKYKESPGGHQGSPGTPRASGCSSPRPPAFSTRPGSPAKKGRPASRSRTNAGTAATAWIISAARPCR